MRFGAMFMLIGVVLLPGAEPSYADRAATSAIDITSNVPAAALQAGPATEQPAILEFDVVRSGLERLELVLGRSRGRGEDRVFFKRKEGRLPPPGTALTPILGTFRRAGAGGQIDRVGATATVLDSETVEVRVTLDPKGEHEGRYFGTIGFAGSAVSGEPVLVTVLMQFPDYWIIVLLCLLVLGGAVAAVYLASDGSQSKDISTKGCWEWTKTHPVAVVSAAMLVVGVYFNAYEADPDWRWPTDVLQFVPTAYAAATGALASAVALGTVRSS